MADSPKGSEQMSPVIDSLIAKYNPITIQDHENALKEIIQEITLAGLAKGQFYDRAAFYGGTALRIFYGLPRFSEDLDFTLLKPAPDFSLKNYFNAVKETLASFGFEVEAEEIDKKNKTDIESAFLKANTKIHLLKISSGQKFADKIQFNKKLSIKFEVDTTPPLGFETEVKILTPPITSSIRLMKLPYLFSGKMHAILFRKWGARVKGRDFYDLLWYIGRKTPINLLYMENKMRDGGQWTEHRKLEPGDLTKLLEKRIEGIDFKIAGQDVIAFIKDPREVDLWTKDFFKTAIQDLNFE
jgi:predicted nucleotidyltransferase component of viral defense system